MGSKTYEGICFSVYSLDRSPPHVHASAEDMVAIIDILAGGEVQLADRKDCVTPANGKRSTVAKMLRVAGDNVDELNALWEKTHGTR